MTIGNAPLPGSTIGLLGAGKISTIEDELFVAGKSFSYEDYLVIPIGDGTLITFDPTAFAGEQIIFNPLLFVATAGPITVDIFPDPDTDNDGTPLQGSNRREGMPNPMSVLQLNPTINNIGTKFAGDLIPASGAGVGNANGGSNEQGLPFEVLLDRKKGLRFNNQDGAGVILQIKLTWFEI